MLALLKLIPIKDWIYIGIIVALLPGYAVFVHHERVVGAYTVKAADAKVVAAQTKLNQEIEAHAQTTVTQIAKTFADVVSAPPAADAPHLRVCDNALSGSTPSADAGPASSANGSTDVPAAVPSAGAEVDPADIGPPLDKSFEDADAQVTGLQDYIKACQTAGLCKQ